VLFQATPSAAAPAEPAGKATAPGQVKKAAPADPTPAAPECPTGSFPDSHGGCFTPTCPDGSAVPESGECPSSCPDGAQQCEQVRSCPVDSPLPLGSTCEHTSTASPTVTAPSEPAQDPSTQGGATAALAPAVQASLFGRPAEVLGTQLVREEHGGAARSANATRAPAAAPRFAARAASGETATLATTGSPLGGATAAGGILLLIGTGLVVCSARDARETYR